MGVNAVFLIEIPPLFKNICTPTAINSRNQYRAYRKIINCQTYSNAPPKSKSYTNVTPKQSNSDSLYAHIIPVTSRPDGGRTLSIKDIMIYIRVVHERSVAYWMFNEVCGGQRVGCSRDTSLCDDSVVLKVNILSKNISC